MNVSDRINNLNANQRKLLEALLKKQGVDAKKYTNDEEQLAAISVAEEKDYYQMSSAQKRLFIINQMYSNTISYNMPCYVKIKGKLDIVRLENAYNSLIERHEALRTSFHVVEGEPIQKINKNIKLHIEQVNLASEAEINKCFEDFVRPFDLMQAPLMRVRIATLNDIEHIMAFDAHHIITDGVTMSIIINELGKLYNGIALPQQRLQYKDFSEWQNGDIGQKQLKKQEAYWLEVFKNDIVPLNFPTDYIRPSVQSLEGNSIVRKLDKTLSNQLNQLAKENGTTLYITLLAAFNILLAKYTGQEDIIVGSPVAGRTHDDLKNIVGVFVNTLAMRNYPRSKKSFKQFLNEVKENSVNAYENQDYPFETLIEKLNIERSLERNPLFDMVFVMQNTGNRDLIMNELEFIPFEMDNKISKFDLTFNIEEEDQGISIDAEYATSLFKKETIERMLNHYTNILVQIVTNPEQSIADIELIDSMEKEEILFRFNNSIADYPREKTIVHIFEEQVKRVPNHIAVCFNEMQLTYSELNESVNKVARYLKGKQIAAEEIIGIMVEPSLEMVIGILGILKAGGTYLPINPEYPKERVQFMLEDSGAKLLLVTEEINLESYDLQIESMSFEAILKNIKETSDLPIVSKPHHVAYIIYTSGTTGKPKGAMIEHHNVVRLLYNDKCLFDFSEKDTWTMFHSMCFDFSVWEMYGALLYGGTLVIVSKGVARDPSLFYQLLKQHQVTVLNQTPTAFSNLQKIALEDKEEGINLRYIIFGGEALQPNLLKEWHTRYAQTKLINMYGITETTVHVTYKEIGDEEIARNISNIGKPIPTLSTYIMDKNLKLLPIGVPGELCVAGEGVCRGYLNRPELTNQKFITNPYKPNERLYRSGDLARFLSNGELEYLGRIDQQVKIRGHRVEIGEVENLILKHEIIQQATVVVREDKQGEKYLCAYIVSDQKVTAELMRKYLHNILPDYMIPSYFVQLESLPMTTNGKINKKELPEPQDYIVTEVAYVAPQNTNQQIMAQIWQEELGVHKIGIHDNFFSTGGDSIKAIRIINSMNKVLQTQIQMQHLYLNQTIVELERALSEKGLLGREVYKEGMALVEEIQNRILSSEEKKYLPDEYEDFYPLSQIQNGMVFYSKLRPDEPIYHDQFIFYVQLEKFSEALYIKALKILMKQHPILRTTFDVSHFDRPIQIVHKEIEPLVHIEDCSIQSKEQQVAIINKYLKHDLEDKFDFNKGLLWRIGLFKINSANKYTIVLSFQHAILDGWSVSTFNRDFLEVFTKLAQNENCEAVTLPSSYKDYVAINLRQHTSEKTQTYWKDTLAGYSRNKLPFNYLNKTIKGRKGNKIYRKDIDNQLLHQLEEKAHDYHCTVKDICLSAHIYLLSLLSTEHDVITGFVTHDRPTIEGSEKILGCFLNTVPIRIQLTQNKIDKFELIDKVKSYLKEVKAHELFLADIANITGNTNKTGNPIFDTLFNFTDFHVMNDLSQFQLIHEIKDELEIESKEMTNTLFDLEVSKTLDNLRIQIKYDTAYFYEEDIQMAMSLYIRILEFFLSKETVLTGEKILTKEEKDALIYEFNDTEVAYDAHKTMHQLFEDQVNKTPNNIALSYDGETLTYLELNSWANQLARMLIANGVKSGDNVALIADRGFNMIIGMLSILKAGGAYVPIDPEYPIARQEYILNNGQISVIVADEVRENFSNLSNQKIIYINKEALNAYESCNLELYKDSKDLAYIIYTSGSTGVPKGVMIEHQAAVNLIQWVNKRFEVSEKDTLLFITSMCFDLSVYDIHGMLATGGKIVIAQKEQVKNPNELLQLVNDAHITFWDSVPSTMNYLINTLEDKQLPFIQENLRLVFMSGDWIPVQLPNRMKKYFPNAQVISLGGATEGTIWSIYYPIEEVSEEWSSIPYGKPLANNTFYILDDNENIVPQGVAGELCIGGTGVARGYMGDVNKTKAAFKKNPFTDKWTGMMYKTGDLGRMLPDGNIEFLGRKDYQVKIRGYRIELGEIESQLQKHVDIREAVVLDLTDQTNTKYLCAYIVLKQQLTTWEIKEYLADKLPDYMIPSRYIYLEQLPLTSNGKIDRKALPKDNTEILDETPYQAPRNAIETKLIDIWKELLEVNNVSIYHNFFELGGHSLKATMLISRINKAFNIEIPLRVIFANPTVEGMAAYIAEQDKKEYTTIEKVEKQPFYLLSSAQKRMYLLSQHSEVGVTYNTPDAVILEGELDVDKLQWVFKQLIERHESFRTSFEIVDGNPVQIIHDTVPFEIDIVNCDTSNVADELKEFIRPFDLTKAPLLRVKLIKVNAQKHILAYDMHHIISDGMSMNILIQEFNLLYSGQTLPPLAIQYKDFANWQNELRIKGELAKQEHYWLETLGQDLQMLNLPTDFKRPSKQSFEGDHLEFTIDQLLTKQVMDVAKKTETTLFMILLAAYNILLSKYTGQEDIIVGTPISGRNHDELENVIGMFVNTLVLRSKPKAEITVSEFIDQVKEVSLNAFQNQDYQFEDLVSKLQVKRDLSHNPLIDVMFVLQNVGDDKAVKLGGLEVKPYNLKNVISKLDLSLEAKQVQDEIIFRFEYCTKLFKAETIERMKCDYITILEKIVMSSEIKISDITLANSYTKQESSITEEIEFDF